MKANYKFKLPLLLCVMMAISNIYGQDDFVKIAGNKFRLNNAPFFPNGVNYGIYLQKDANGNPFICRANAYGNTNDFESTDEVGSYNEILSDFIRIKGFGINCVRIFGFIMG